MRLFHQLKPMMLGSIFVLSACSTNTFDRTQSIVQNAPSYEDMYLRGVFNWWEANEQFKLVESSNDVYSATLELIADGQPYDFKIADSSWTASLNCGAFELKLLTLDEAINLVCQENSLNLQFQPKQTGKFVFTLDASDPFYPELRVSKAVN
jgi:hypothetical protein